VSGCTDRDGWRVHCADTMRGGQYLNDARMAELHAQEAPACVRELEAWGALFDRTNDERGVPCARSPDATNFVA
jgi:succinate dehydrogenase / fumarate reductase, flavoprotein subunit